VNPVEIADAVAELVEEPFDPVEFPFKLLAAFGSNATTIKRLKSGDRNKSDLKGGVLLFKHIHLKVCPQGSVSNTLKTLYESPATSAHKVKFILATDGLTVEAESLEDGESLACEYSELANHFGFFLALAGITTVKQIRENAFDIKATSRLNKLYVELLNHNPDWCTNESREDLNHFFARLIFCFFAEDTGIFHGEYLFTKTIEQMSESNGSNTHDVLAEIFRAMDTPVTDRKNGDFHPWANTFPYVNGGLFTGCITVADIPTFTKIARAYLIQIGSLDWTKINPDIFGSMIQAVADDEERGALGMHYTSVPNILKVLNPLFLNELHDKLEESGGNPRKLLNLRKRLARIRVFDPACGSGNFLVIAYKEIRKIEAEINHRRNEDDRRTDIRLTNYRGIELRHFACEIARLALVIAEFQCDTLYRGETLARAEFLPLDQQNWITHGNALRLDWRTICPPTGTSVNILADDLFSTPQNLSEIDFENEGGETYVCGNPPYLGSQDQSKQQKKDLETAWEGAIRSTKSADYVSGWFYKAKLYISSCNGIFAFVTTNSINQGRQVALIWPAILGKEMEIRFAEPSFKWSNLASNKAAVIVSIIGIGLRSNKPKLLFDSGHVRTTNYIGAYLVPGQDVIVKSSRRQLSHLTPMTNGSMPNDDGNLLLSTTEYREFINRKPLAKKYCKRFLGSHDSIHGDMRYCIWINDTDINSSQAISDIKQRIYKVKKHRLKSDRPETNDLANISHAFGERRHQNSKSLLIPRHSSELRPYLPSVLTDGETVIGDSAIALYNFTLIDFSVYSSRLHLIWIAAVCGKIKSDYRYSNTLGWNTFPISSLTEHNKKDLIRCAEDILLAREQHWPATIADLYDPENMPDDLRAAHERNDEILERIYIGRQFKNDTERLEKLFEMYTKMTSKESSK
jgi:hypothetical protein